MRAERLPSSVSKADDNTLTSKVNNQCWFYISPLQPLFPIQFDYVGKLCSFGSNRLGMKNSEALRSLKFDCRDPNLSERSDESLLSVIEVPLSKLLSSLRKNLDPSLKLTCENCYCADSLARFKDLLKLRYLQLCSF